MEPVPDKEGDRYVALARAVLKNKSFLSRFSMGNRELLSGDNVHNVYFQYNHIVSYANWVEDKHLVVDTARNVDLPNNILYVKYPYPTIKFPMEFAHEIGLFGDGLKGYPTKLSERWTQKRLNVLISTLNVAINLVQNTTEKKSLLEDLRRCYPNVSAPLPIQINSVLKRRQAEGGRSLKQAVLFAARLEANVELFKQVDYTDDDVLMMT